MNGIDRPSPKHSHETVHDDGFSKTGRGAHPLTSNSSPGLCSSLSIRVTKVINHGSELREHEG